MIDIKINEAEVFSSQNEEIKEDYNQFDIFIKKYSELIDKKKLKWQKTLNNLENKKKEDNKDLNL